jgi:hypothetical protein
MREARNKAEVTAERHGKERRCARDGQEGVLQR